jgi:hypothetical protein
MIDLRRLNPVAAATFSQIAKPLTAKGLASKGKSDTVEFSRTLFPWSVIVRQAVHTQQGNHNILPKLMLW